MLLTISTTHQPATELGYLLHKHPDLCQSFTLPFGQAHVFYPEADTQRCTVVLLVEVNPVKLARRRGSSNEQYLSDRPYVASSFLSVAIAQVFNTALAGRSQERLQLAQTPIPLVARLSVVPCREGEGLLRQLFEPLGYFVSTTGHLLDENFPEWGQSDYYTVELQHTLTLAELLSHLYVLIPLLDEHKYNWIDDEEVEKLLRHGESWLNTHPAREQIIKSYFQRPTYLTRPTLARLLQEENFDPDQAQEKYTQQEAAIETPLHLNEHRINVVVDTLKHYGAKRVIDLGCGQGDLLTVLLKDSFFEQVTGVDVSSYSLKVARERLDRLPLPRNQWNRLQLIQGALSYQDERFHGYDAATVIEVIEHLDLPRLEAFEQVLFEFAKPKIVILTTPNIEYNIKLKNLASGKLRHQDHRFEWTRAEFQTWAERIGQRFGYTVEFQAIGEEDSEVGSPTQMAIWLR
ncbi:methyltransferase type 12 [Hapalosiphon sp. MRB220]|nr:methyltransferase type 12 [Hapalosiphon sp. MRB220]